MAKKKANKFEIAEEFGWCLSSPSGKLLPQTFDVDQDQSWSKAFSYLYYRSSWMEPYWKQWHESIAAAAKRGWEIIPVKVTYERDKA